MIYVWFIDTSNSLGTCALNNNVVPTTTSSGTTSPNFNTALDTISSLGPVNVEPVAKFGRSDLVRASDRTSFEESVKLQARLRGIMDEISAPVVGGGGLSAYPSHRIDENSNGVRPTTAGQRKQNTNQTINVSSKASPSTNSGIYDHFYID